MVISGAVLIMVALALAWDMSETDTVHAECYYPYLVSGGIVGTVCWYADGSTMFCGQTEDCNDFIEMNNMTVVTPVIMCDPSYPDFCLPHSIADLDCDDIQYRGFAVRYPDTHRFDRDGDGIGCET